MRKPDAHRRNQRSVHLLATVIALAALATFALVSAAFGQAPQSGPPAASAAALRGNAQVGIDPASKSTGGLASGELRAAVARLEAGKAAPAGVDMVGREGIRIEILHSLGAGTLSELVGRLGGSRLRPVDATTAEAVVPYDELEALEAAPGVSFVRPPLDIAAPQEPIKPFAGSVLGQHVGKTNASTWHLNGRVGAGVRVGIIDSFSPGEWNAGIASGDLPNPAGVYCINAGAACDFWSVDASTHGVGVAEIIHDMAPSASLYLAHTRANSGADLVAVVDYFASQGVRVISRSLTAQYDGPGNGTGPIANAVNYAVSKGMIWLNSAGNSGGPASSGLGSYWRGSFADTDNDGYLDFTPGDETMGFYCGYLLGLRWSDWGPAADRTDYDIRIYDDANLTVLEGSGLDEQQNGAPPLEHPIPDCDGGITDVDYLTIYRFAPGSGTAGDVLEFMTNGTYGNEYWSNPYSATQPASDSANPGALSVGAIEPWDGFTLANYSSQGPSNDNRIKPDLSAGTCVTTLTTGTGCFGGTSGATPVVAGAAALILGVNPAATPVDVRNYLLTQAVADRGPAGPDNAYGVGELILPALAPPPPPPPPPPVPRNPQAGDRRKPTARAFLSKGVRGSKVRLRYRVFDNSGQTREILQVKRGSKIVRTFHTRYGATGKKGRIYYVSWRSPRARGHKRPAFRFCVQAFDRAGNKSPRSCAGIRLRMPRGV